MMNEMTPIESLHYAIGEMAYAMASVDGLVQNEEKKKFHDIVCRELKQNHASFNTSEIIFKILDKNKRPVSETYDWATNEIRTNSHYVSPELKTKFIEVIEKIAAAYPPVTKEERQLLKQFTEFLSGIEGDPVYYK
jgi:uncharacterized tellurite resistance protein B-like protein